MCSHRFERRFSGTPIEIVGAQHELIGIQWSRDPDRDHPVFVSVGKGAEEKAINDAENCGAGTDAQSYGENRGDCNAGRPKKTAACITEVLAKAFYKHMHHSSSPVFLGRPYFRVFTWSKEDKPFKTAVDISPDDTVVYVAR